MFWRSLEETEDGDSSAAWEVLFLYMSFEIVGMHLELYLGNLRISKNGKWWFSYAHELIVTFIMYLDLCDECGL